MALVPQGRYRAVITPTQSDDGSQRIRFGSSSQKGTKFVQAHFRVLGGEYDGERVRWRGYFTKATGKRTLESLRYCGMKGDDLYEAAESQPFDQVVEIQVEHDEFTNESGEERVVANVAWVNRLGGGAVKIDNQMSADELRQFAAQLRSRLVSVGEVDGERHTDAPADSAPPAADDVPDGVGFDDDIPF